MPQSSGSSKRKKPRAGSTGGRPKVSQGPNAAVDLDDEEHLYALRKIGFAVVSALIIAAALLFAATALKDRTPGGNPEINARTSRAFTVCFRVMPAADEGVAKRILETRRVSELVDGADLFLKRTAEGDVALCAGRFARPDETEARELLARMRDFEARPGTQAFPGARIWRYIPPPAD